MPVDLARGNENAGAGGDGSLLGTRCHDAFTLGDVEDLLVGVGVEVQSGPGAESDQQDTETSRIFGID